MKKIRKNLKWITIIITIIIIICGVMIKYSLLNDSVEIKDELIEELELQRPEENVQTTEIKEVPKKVYVDIKGAVNNPGVYEIEENKKVIDVIELAGGFTGQANTSMINLAKKVSDEMVIIIYTEDEVKKSQEENTVIKIVEQECICPEINNDACLNQNNDNKNSNNESDSTNFEKKLIDINKATIEELLTLTGIGVSKAEAIIKYREENGNFSSIEDIINVPGIGESLYEKIKDSITI